MDEYESLLCFICSTTKLYFMIQGKEYTFKELQDFLIKHDKTNVCLVVNNIQYKERAIMHIFLGDFCGDWKSGDVYFFTLMVELIPLMTKTCFL